MKIRECERGPLEDEWGETFRIADDSPARSLPLKGCINPLADTPCLSARLLQFCLYETTRDLSIKPDHRPELRVPNPRIPSPRPRTCSPCEPSSFTSPADSPPPTHSPSPNGTSTASTAAANVRRRNTTNSSDTMPVTSFSVPEKYKYQNGFGSYHECVPSCTGNGRG